MRNKYLLSYGELGLKGKNQKDFINTLIKNISSGIKEFGKFKFINTYGRIFVESDIQEEQIENVILHTFGLTGFAKVCEFELDFERIQAGIKDVVASRMLPSHKTFKISARRSNKNFPLCSDDLNKKLGAFVLNNFPNLTVSLKNPDLNINLEIREQGAYVYLSMQKAYGGLPVGCSGRGLLMLSGGIDSPVAGWMMLKRGMQIQPIHFFSPPYTSERAKQKVVELSKKLKVWGGANRLMIVKLTPIQLTIDSSPRKELSTLLIRKVMVKISENICKNERFQAVITGENLGQVASQTVESMTATGWNCEIPIFRPLIGFDKNDTIDVARKIDTYDISIQPYEDCCTLFLPEFPKTKPKVEELEKEFENLKLNELIQTALNEIEIVSL
ncbi:MAG: hypothetical protein ACD_79C00466G0018 [uncultured bacterium]|nr:MAG: hypothetical protein ACD_79C00466G0018 [uncultured bacterium]